MSKAHLTDPVLKEDKIKAIRRMRKNGRGG